MELKLSQILLLCIFLGKIGEISSAKILVVAFISTKSHKLTYMPLVEELGKRGHNVTVLTPIPATKHLQNVNEVLTFDVEKASGGFMENQFKKKAEGKADDPFKQTDYFVKICRQTYALPHVQAIMQEQFDLVMMQPLLNECALGFTYRIGAPVVFFFPVSIPNYLALKFGNDLPISFVPNVFVPFTPEMNFIERMTNVALNFSLWFRYLVYYVPYVEALYKEVLGDDIPSVSDLQGNASLYLSNGHFSVHYHKPLLPDIVEVGGLSRKSKVPQSLDKELEDFIRKGKDGFIYFSMGTHMQLQFMPENKKRIFLNVFSKLKQQVIWKWDKDPMPNLPENVKLSKWLPQEDVMAHKEIKLFITHCGGGGTEEAVYHGVPMIGLPFFADQPLNAKIAQSHGILIELDWNELTEELLLNLINEILNNPYYTNNVKRLSAIYKDRPEEPMTKAVYWVEYIIRHKGAPHLRSVARKLNWIQLYSLDVILAYVLSTLAIIYFIYVSMKWIISKICKCLAPTVMVGQKQKKL